MRSGHSKEVLEMVLAGPLVGLAVSLSLVALALQKFVLLAPKEQP